MDDSFSIVLKKMFGFAQNQVTGERKRWKKKGQENENVGKRRGLPGGLK